MANVPEPEPGPVSTNAPSANVPLLIKRLPLTVNAPLIVAVFADLSTVRL